MRGYIEERKDRGRGVYRLRVDAGVDPVTGRRRQPRRTIHVRGPKPDTTWPESDLGRWLLSLWGRGGRRLDVMFVFGSFEVAVSGLADLARSWRTL